MMLQGCGGETPAPVNNVEKKEAVYVDPGQAPEGQKEPGMEANVEVSPEKSAVNSEPVSSGIPITIDAVSWDGLQAEIKKHQGKVVVVDMWAFTCIPCKKEFPHFVELQKMLDDKVVCISVNCDYVGLEEKNVESYKPNALKFLLEKKAEMRNFILNEPQPDVFAKISLTALPAVYVYKRDGSLAQRFDYDLPEFSASGFSYKDHINPLVNKLLVE
jgi:thiol-disulfide isomerase/thioredoxin